jgi:dTDP-4-amino-4,6-dideoxygalactose transaminase
LTALNYHGRDRRYAEQVDEVLAIVREVGESDEFILKSRAAALETAIAQRTGARHAIACASGTGALTLALTGLGIGRGDEVITPAFSFVTSASAIALAGATPVFADVDPVTATLDPGAAESAITPYTKALLPAHVFSCAPEMKSLQSLADAYVLALIEDSAISLGATVDGRPAGRHGDVGVFSFFPGKSLGGVGDAGMVITDNDRLAKAVRMLRNHGQDLQVRFLHHKVGFNCRMDEIAAGYLLRQLPGLDGVLDQRRRLARQYSRRLWPLAPEIIPPPPGFAGRAVYTYVVRATDRDKLREHLSGRGIETAVYCPRPLHLQPVFASLGYSAGDFPVAERLSKTCLALPLYPGLCDDEIDQVCTAIAEFYSGTAYSGPAYIGTADTDTVYTGEEYPGAVYGGRP